MSPSGRCQTQHTRLSILNCGHDQTEVHFCHPANVSNSKRVFSRYLDIIIITRCPLHFIKPHVDDTRRVSHSSELPTCSFELVKPKHPIKMERRTTLHYTAPEAWIP